MIKNIVVLVFAILRLESLPAQMWQFQGPQPFNYVNYGKVAGRIWSMAISPAHSRNGVQIPATLFVGTDGGGIWRSQDFEGNASPSWQPITDKLLPDAQHIMCLTVAPNNPDLIVAGTQSGVLLQSTDDGNSWTKVIITDSHIIFLKGHATHLTYSSALVNVVFNPVTNDLYIGMQTDGVFIQSGNYFTSLGSGIPDQPMGSFDIVTNPAGNAIIYMTTLKDYSTPKAPGLWMLSSPSATWQNQALNLQDIQTGMVMPSSEVAGMYLQADHRTGSPNGIYCLVANDKPGNYLLLNVFQNKQGVWNPIGNAIKGCQDFNMQNGLAASSTFFTAGISPEGFVYLGIGNPQYSPIYQSLDGGVNYAAIENDKITGYQPHVDPHCFAFYNGMVYIGNDGGVYRFTPGVLQGRNIWQNLNTNSLTTILSQGVSMSPVNPGIILSGNQDNDIGRLESGVWSDANGAGDNARIAFDPDPNNKGLNAFYTTLSNFSFFWRSDDGGKSWRDISPQDAIAQNANVGDYAVFAFHPQNSARMAVGIDRVYETPNRGDDQWGSKAISPIFLPSTTPHSNGNATAIAYGPGNIIWVAYYNKLYITANDGGDGSWANWTDYGQGQVFNNGSIVDIVTDQRFPGNLYLGIANGHVWFFNNNGSGWKDITGNLNVTFLNRIAVVASPDNLINPVIYAATNQGIYFCSDQDNPNWLPFNNGLPVATVSDLQYSTPNRMLVAGLYGRGVYTYNICFNDNPKASIGHIPEDPECPTLPVQGETNLFGLSLTGNSCNLGYQISWSVSGGTPSAGETGQKNNFSVDIPLNSTSVNLVLTLTFNDGRVISISQPFAVVSPEVASITRAICRWKDESRLKPIPWWEWDKEKYSNNNLQISIGEILTMERMARQLLNITLQLKTLNLKRSDLRIK